MEITMSAFSIIWGESSILSAVSEPMAVICVPAFICFGNSKGFVEGGVVI